MKGTMEEKAQGWKISAKELSVMIDIVIRIQASNIITQYHLHLRHYVLPTQFNHSNISNYDIHWKKATG